MQGSRLMAAAAFGVAMAGPAMALQVDKSAEFKSPPSQVWAAIGNFCGIAQWHPAIASCTPSMTSNGHPVRTLALKGGGQIVEEQVSRSDSDMTYTYIIVHSPLPVKDYKSTISVQKGGDGSMVTWTGTFEASGAPDEKAKSVIQGIYDSGLSGLATKVK